MVVTMPWCARLLIDDLNIAEAVAHGHSSARGPFIMRVEELLSAELGALQVLLTTSCTDALEMTAMLLELGPGDVVIVPSSTFSSTATAFARQGASVRFCDIRTPELGLDPDRVEAMMDERVKAIVTVHYAGVASDVKRLREIADRYGVALIEDNAHSLFAEHGGAKLGSFGQIPTLSFHETKNFTCGGGGALVINDPAFVDSAQILLDKGTNRRQFLDGLVDKYTWQGQGHRLAFRTCSARSFSANLKVRKRFRRNIGRFTRPTFRLLEPYAPKYGVTLPFQHPSDKPADHMFYALLPTVGQRAGVIASMRAAGVASTFHYVPLHSAPGAKALGDGRQNCPITDISALVCFDFPSQRHYSHRTGTGRRHVRFGHGE